MIDPDKPSILENYDLDAFRNSIWENFLGSQIEYVKLIEPDGTHKVTNQNIEKMGPIQLRVKDGSLYQAWDNSRRGETDGFKGDKPG